MKRTYQFRIYNSKKNRKLEQLLGIACSVYNHCIALQKRYYRLFKKNITAFTMSKHLAKLKKMERFHFLTRLNSQTVQDISERVWRSYKSFFSNVKE
ncbi:MAG: helix-turn-helix domain-containing protein, partial [Acidaminococcaceae bacterium]|nr:helix-turn-helix domain-containing protein [Acidaminococcaceae bacterium]